MFLSKTTIMVNKREKIYCIISISDKRQSSFIISSILPLSFYSFLLFFPTFFVLILLYLSRFFSGDISGRNLLSSFGHFRAEHFSQVGGARAPSASPLRTRLPVYIVHTQFFTRPRMGPSLGFVTNDFFF